MSSVRQTGGAGHRSVRRWPPGLVTVVAAALLTTLAWTADARAERSFGLVIGYNWAEDGERPPLRYADDDAVENALLLAQLGAEAVVLLTRLDAETAALHPELTSTPPTRTAIGAALDELNGRMNAVRAAGERPVLYLFYAGHGDVENNEGYVHIAGGRLTRSDLIELLRRSRAHQNHVIVDACKSYFLVFDRGTGGERSPVLGELVADSQALPPNTGVLVSTSSAADSHEWEAFRGGIFSHEVRSALRGAADVDGDGRVTYREAAAFVWTANATIPVGRYRPALFARAPEGADDLLLDLARARGTWLLAGPGADRHHFVEDGRGRRLADFHPGPTQRLRVLVPPARPLFVRHAADGAEVALPPGDTVALADLSPRRPSVGARGAEHVAFQSLFSVPFDGDAIHEYETRPVLQVEETSPDADELAWLRYGLGVAALAAGVTGGTMTALAYAEREGVGPDTSGRARAEANARIGRYNTAAVTLYAVAGLAAAGYLTWTLWPEDDVDIEILPAPTEGGAAISLTVGF